MVLSPCSSHLTFLALIYQRILISAYHSSQWSTWCRDVESRIQQLSCALDNIIGEYSRFKENVLTSLKPLVFCEWKSDIFWQVPHHHRWRVRGALAKKDSTVLSTESERLCVHQEKGGHCPLRVCEPSSSATWQLTLLQQIARWKSRRSSLLNLLILKS